MLKSDHLPVKALTPAARPVDLYHRPQEQGVAKPDMSGADQLADLAKSLGVANDRLGAFFDREKKRQDAEAGAKGARAALENNKLGWNEYLDQLKTSDPERFEQMQGGNPWIERGYEAQRLQNLGMDYFDQLDADTSANPVLRVDTDGTEIRLQDAKDQGEIHGFLVQHLKGYVQANGLDKVDDVTLTENFLPKAHEAQAAWVRRNAAERREALVDKRLSALATNSALQLTKAFREGGLTVNPAETLTSLGATLGANIREAHAGGVRDFEKLNDKTVEAVVAAAKLYENPRFLDVLNHIETSPGNNLGGVPKYQLIAEQTRQHLQNLSAEKERMDEWRREKQRKQFSEGVMAPVVQRMLKAMKDPNLSISDLDVSTEVEKLTKAGMGAEAMTLMSWRTSLINQETNVKLDISRYGEAKDKIQKGEMSTSDIVAGTGRFWSDEVARSLIQDKQFYDRLRDDREGDLFRSVDAVMNDDVRFIKEAIGGTSDFSATTPKDVRNRALEAVARYRDDLQSMMMDHAERNGGKFPRPHEVRSMAAKLRQEIINDPLYRSANSNDDRFMSPGEQKDVRARVPNARAGDFDVFRRPAEQVKQDLDRVIYLGASEQELSEMVSQYEATQTGLIPAMAAYLGMSPGELIAKQTAAHRRAKATRP